MRKRALGNTGLQVSELALGTWGLSGDGYGAVDAATQDAVIDRARALGINLIDTADSYGMGAMETRLGERLENDPDAQIVTKLGTDRKTRPPKKCFTQAFLKEAFAKSQERLKREVIDVVLLHNPSPRTFERGEGPAFFQELKEQGKVKAWGASVGDGATARAAIAAGAGVLELVYNAFLSQDLHALQSEIKEKQVGVLARSVLAHGLLCGTWSRFKVFPVGDHRRDRWTQDQLRKRVDQASSLRTLMSDEVQSARAGALRFVLSNEAVSSAVIGPRSTVQLDQLVREAGKGPPYLPEDRLRRLGTRLAEVGIVSEPGGS